MLNIVFPIAGRGLRFLEAGYAVPKPLIPVRGRPMIEVVVHNIRPGCPHRSIFVAQQEHLERAGLRQTLEQIDPKATLVSASGVTEGAACTVLLAKHFIDRPEPLMIANSDQWVDCDIDDYLDRMDREKADGLIMTMWADDPKWSYVGIDESAQVSRVAEKQVISNEATVGIYNFRRGSDFVWAAERMIEKNLRVNGEFYIAPVYNELIARGSRIVIHNIGRVSAGMWGLGTPSDLDSFLADPIAHKAVAFRRK